MFTLGFEKIAVSVGKVKEAIMSDFDKNFLPRHIAGKPAHPATDLLATRIQTSLEKATGATSHKDRVSHLRNAMSDSRKLHGYPYTKGAKKVHTAAAPAKRMPMSAARLALTAGTGALGYLGYKHFKDKKQKQIAMQNAIKAQSHAPVIEQDPYAVLGG